MTVNEVNVAPELGSIGNQSVDEGTELTFTATATDDDLPAQALTFSLADGTAGSVPAGAAIDPDTGVFSWTPTEGQDGAHTFDLVVTDGAASDSETITITVNPSGEIEPSEIVGLVWEDFNNDGEVNFGEKAIENVTIVLTGTDDLGNTVNRTTQTDINGIYMFYGLRPGDYAITEIQPTGFEDGTDTLGTVNGAPAGDNPVNDVFSGVILPEPGSVAENYNFGERPLPGSEVTAGQTATIGFWQNKNGQALLESLNGGPNSTQLGNWLATTFPNMYGADAGSNDLTGMTNAEVADFYRDIFRRKKKEARQLGLGGPTKMDTQVMAMAFATYVTNETLAGSTAADFGFMVTQNGVGVSTFNVGSNGYAFAVENDSDVTILDLLLATDNYSINGILYDLDEDGDADDELEILFRTIANNVYSSINEQGGAT